MSLLNPSRSRGARLTARVVILALLAALFPAELHASKMSLPLPSAAAGQPPRTVGVAKARCGPLFLEVTWDIENRLIKVVKADNTTIDYAYDVDGVRVETKTTPAGQAAQATSYLVDTSGGLSHVVAETNSAGALQTFYVRGDDLIGILRPAGGSAWTSRFVHADGIGSIRRLTDETGNITDGYTYTAFGELLAHTGTDPQPYAFAGEPLDLNSGFQYHRARWMDPMGGRFFGMDSFGGMLHEPRTLHKYQYVGANPLNRSDPTGQFESVASLMTSFSMQAVLVRAGIGGVIGGADAFLGGYSIRDGVLSGAAGGVAGPLIPFRIGMAFATYGVGQALYQGDYDSALFRAAGLGFGYVLQTRGFASFAEFKKFWGPAGTGRAWHHIVEQTPGNVGSFGMQAIHNPSNIAPLAHGAGTVHAKISGFYSSKQPGLTGTTGTVRQWLSAKPFAEQYQFGLEAMARFGGGSSAMNVSGGSAAWSWPAILSPFSEGDGFGQE